MNIERLIQRAAIIVFLCVIAMPTLAQTQAWDTNIVTWTGPTTCVSGQPIANCPVTGYRVERASTTTGTFSQVGTTGPSVVTFTHNVASAGQNCYRVIALSNSGNSDPSNVACKTNVQPSGPPSPPTNLRVVDQVVFDLRRDGSAWYLSRHVGNVPVGTQAVRRYTVANGAGYCQVLRSDVQHVKASKGVLVAKCA